MFNVLDRYLLKTFIRASFVALLVFLLIYLIVDVVEHLDDYIDNGAKLSTVVRYYIYFFPFIITQTTPVAVLLGAMFSISLMARRNEILALNSSGVSLYRIAQPLLLGGLLISVSMFVFADRIVPEANKKKLEIKYGEMEKNSSYGSEQVNKLIYLGSGGRIFRFGGYNPAGSIAQNVRIHTITDNRLVEQLDCAKLVWNDTVWIAIDGRIRRFERSDSAEAVEELTEFDTLRLSTISETPERFEKSEIIRKGSEKDFGFDMSIDELRRTIQFRRMAAVQTTREEVFFNLKYSLPLASFIIVLLAVPLASDPRRGSIAVGFAFSAGITFLYILLFETGHRLGSEGSIPPVLAAWGVNGLFLLVGIVLMLKARK